MHSVQLLMPVLSLEVSLVKLYCQVIILKTKLQRMKGKLEVVEGGGGADENGMLNLIFRTLTFYFPPPLLIHAIEDHFRWVVKENPSIF